MSDDPRHRLGREGEEIAARHLIRLGYRVIERNYRTRFGELDLVAWDGCTLVFCEVKTRRALAAGRTPFESLGRAQQKRIRQMAADWLCRRSDRPRSAELRFDAIAVTIDG